MLPEDRHQAAIARITELELADVDDIVVLPGAAEALASLVGAKNAIATSCTIPLAQARIRAAQLVPPSMLITADDVARGKPHPDPFLEAAERLGVDPTRCLVVEDAPMGLEAARAAGCFTLAVVTTTPPRRAGCRRDRRRPVQGRVRGRPDGIRVRLRPSVREARLSPSCGGRCAWSRPGRGAVGWS